MKNSTVAVIAIAIGVAFALALSIPIVLFGYSGVSGGQNSYSSPFGGMMGSMMSVQGQTIQISQAPQFMKNVPSNAQLVSSNNTIIFSGSNVKLVVLATDLEGAANLTSSAPPSYASDNVFVIYGLINPTLVIPRGTSLQIIFINLDNADMHNFVIGTISPPYPYMAMQGMMYSYSQSGPSRSSPAVYMMPFLPPANWNQGTAHEYTYTVTLGASGDLWYLCAYPGHAQMGMYGKILVR